MRLGAGGGGLLIYSGGGNIVITANAIRCLEKSNHLSAESPGSCCGTWAVSRFPERLSDAAMMMKPGSLTPCVLEGTSGRQSFKSSGTWSCLGMGWGSGVTFWSQCVWSGWWAPEFLMVWLSKQFSGSLSELLCWNNALDDRGCQI